MSRYTMAFFSPQDLFKLEDLTHAVVLRLLEYFRTPANCLERKVTVICTLGARGILTHFRVRITHSDRSTRVREDEITPIQHVELIDGLKLEDFVRILETKVATCMVVSGLCEHSDAADDAGHPLDQAFAFIGK
ncbi:MAG: hypothetical protein AAB691_01590 [Patescibacteria group bacterium]